jgi:hypothetical protein
MVHSTQTEGVRCSDLRGPNRRARVRYRCSPPNPGRAFLANSSKSVDAAVVDLSVGGVGLILDNYVEPGTLVRIELGDGGKDICVDLVAEISHATHLEDGRWRCGCEWIRPLTEEELLVLR